MHKILLIFAMLFTLHARAQSLTLTTQVRAACSGPATQLRAFEKPAIKSAILAKLDCLYVFAIARSGGPNALLMSPEFRQLRTALAQVPQDILNEPAVKAGLAACPMARQTSEIVICFGPQKRQLVEDLLLARAVMELTRPSLLPPLANPAQATLNQIRVAHEAILNMR